MRLYIAGPMTGIPDFNYAAFRLADNLLSEVGYDDILNPINACIDCTHDSETKPHTWDWYMRSALRMVSLADGIATLPGWEDSTGASTEVFIAGLLKMPVKSLLEWLQSASAADTTRDAVWRNT